MAVDLDALALRHQELMAILQRHPKEKSLIDSVSLEYELAPAHQFVRSVEYDEQHQSDWRLRMARRYYERLNKEYAICDLSRYAQDQIGLRWRTSDEVISGKGQFVCAAKKCSIKVELHSYEVPFRYKEDSVDKLELVKVRVCFECAQKLFHKKIESMKKKRKVVGKKKSESDKKKRRKRRKEGREEEVGEQEEQKGEEEEEEHVVEYYEDRNGLFLLDSHQSLSKIIKQEENEMGGGGGGVTKAVAKEGESEDIAALFL